MTAQSFNSGWTYRQPLGPFAAVQGVEARPTPVTLPHDALRDADRSPDAVGKGAGAYYPPGAYAYLKTFDVPSDWAGKSITLAKYGLISVGLGLSVMSVLLFKGAPFLLALFVGCFAAFGVPHFAVGMMIKRRIAKFTVNFPDAIELMVRGLRSGLPITETLGIVATELQGPVGVEFRGVSDKMKIGRTMEAALQETADRLGTPEFQFFVITLAIQRETGGNLAETLSNLADVLRKRAQMKLKIRAMSSESKASAYIVGSLPFIVFFMIWWISPQYIGQFFIDERLMVAGIGGAIWMGIGAFIMAKMVSFEI